MTELTDVQLLQSIWAALRRIEDNLALPPAPLELPAPHVTVAPPDLTDIVTAVTSLNGTGPTAAEIASAIAAVIAPPPAASPDGAEALQAVAEALKKLDYRLKGMGVQAYGGGSSIISNFSEMPLGLTNTQLRASAVPVSTAALASLATSQATVTATQIAVPTTNLTGRKTISIAALGANAANVYVGLTGVTASTGWELAAGASLDLDMADTVQLYAIASSGSQKVSVLEVA